MHFRKIGINSGIYTGKIGIRNRYVFEAAMAHPRPKSCQVPPPPRAAVQDDILAIYICLN